MAPKFSFAFQPIVDVDNRSVHSYEALVRGPNNEPAKWVLRQYAGVRLRSFDVAAQLEAIKLAARLGLPNQINLNLNLLPDLMADRYEDQGTVLNDMLDTAAQCGLRADQLVLELSETQPIADFDCFIERANLYRGLGIRFAIDDFGAGQSGLNLLAEFQPESIKLDMMLVREIQHKGPRQAIIRGVIRTCEDLGIDIVAEGVETMDEYNWLHHEGILLYQGYLFARPGFEALPNFKLSLGS